LSDPIANPTDECSSTEFLLECLSEISTASEQLEVSPKITLKNIMQSTSRSATIFQPNQGKTLFLLGNTVTYKFDDQVQGTKLYEFVGTATSECPPLHTRPWHEWFYFLEGEVAFQVGKRVVQATPGSVIHLPAGVARTFRIKSPQAKFLVGVSNAAAEGYLKDLAEAAQKRELTLPELMAISQNHGIRFVN
jgi:quercetin dioxygenase-like cupin family protein